MPGRSEDGSGGSKPGKRIGVARDRSCPRSETEWEWREIAVPSTREQKDFPFPLSLGVAG